MKIFKFGGASVQDANGVKNVLKVLQNVGKGDELIVLSAMGKTTNVLEKVISDYSTTGSYDLSLEQVKEFHGQILSDLFKDKEKPVFSKVGSLLDEVENFLRTNKSKDYDFVYDQIICYGELISTSILSAYLNLHEIENEWLDARKLIKTDSSYRDAEVQWEETESLIKHGIKKNQLTITQGFIGSDHNNFSTSLGREGSDYTAAIFAYCLDASDVTIWKDVSGVFNGDPKIFENTKLLNQISYEEAIELAFYGASIIHPKTLQPLQQKKIPLFVKSFSRPEDAGTKICSGPQIFPKMPCFIVKKNLVLISLSSLNFSFMEEENISEIFRLFHKYKMKVDLIQNSAISFSVCLENKFNNLDKLISHLKARFKVEFEPAVSLYTIRHFDASAMENLEKGKHVLLKQLTKETVQIVAKDQL